MHSPSLLLCLLVVVSAHFPGFKYLNSYHAPEQAKYYGYGSSSHYGGSYGHGYEGGYGSNNGKGWTSGGEGAGYGYQAPSHYGGYPGHYDGQSSPYGYGGEH